MLDTNTILVRPARRRPADITASLIIPQDEGKPKWQHYFALWLVKEGFYKGKDKDGNTIVAMTKVAKDAITGQTDNGKKRPDLFIHIEGEDEQEEKVWDEILVAWQSKNGNFLTENDEGLKIVIQPREAKEALLKKFARKRMAAIDLTPATPIKEEDTSEAGTADATADI